jgi:hypothetical protein
MKGSIKDKFLLILGGSFLIILLGLLVFNLLRSGVFSNKMGINIAVVGEKGISLLLLRPEEQIVSWVDLPNDTMIKIYNSPASYPVSSLWSYGVGEKKPFETIEKSLGQSMGVILARTMRLSKGGKIEDVLGGLLSLDLKTDLSIRDRFLIRKFLADAVKSKKVLVLSIPDSVFEEKTDPDGKTFLTVNNAVMSLWTKNKFVLEPILDENVDISINNVSDTEGIGLTLARQLESTGMHIIEVKGDKENTVSGTGCLYRAGGNFGMTEAFLKDQAGCNRLAGDDGADAEKIEIWIK